jgi:hypothetical protein
MSDRDAGVLDAEAGLEPIRVGDSDQLASRPLQCPHPFAAAGQAVAVQAAADADDRAAERSPEDGAFSDPALPG